MSNATSFPGSRMVFLCMLAAAAAGCGNGSGFGAHSPPPSDGTVAAATAHPFVPESAVRVRTDTGRNRLWVLGLDDVRVYDLRDRTLLRRIALPSWSVAFETCAPDLALDPSGSAIVSSNAQPTLWRIDAASYEMREYEVRLQGKEGWDIGFGSLQFGADGALYGVAASGSSLWQIDLASRSAELLHPFSPPLTQCSLSRYAWARLLTPRPGRRVADGSYGRE